MMPPSTMLIHHYPLGHPMLRIKHVPRHRRNILNAVLKRHKNRFYSPTARDPNQHQINHINRRKY